jgi:hypothetical protein
MHCAGCHLTFDGITLFDTHRPRGRCIHPSALGLAATKNHIWYRPDTTVLVGSRRGISSELRKQPLLVTARIRRSRVGFPGRRLWALPTGCSQTSPRSSPEPPGPPADIPTVDTALRVRGAGAVVGVVWAR